MKLARSMAKGFGSKIRSASPRGRTAKQSKQGKHCMKRSPSPPSSPQAEPGAAHPFLLRSASQVRFRLTQPLSAGMAKANLESLAGVDRRSGNDQLFSTLGRERPHLLAPLHYFAEAQADMASLRGVDAGMLRYQRRNQELLYRTAMHPKIVGLDGWLVHLCSEKLGGSGCVNAANVDDVNRMFLELQQALTLCEEVGPQELVDVGCDNAAFRSDPLPRPRSFDLDVHERTGRVTRQIEVTSCGRPVQQLSDLRGALHHLCKKVCDAVYGARLEGAIGLTWDVSRRPDPRRHECTPQPFDVGLFLESMAHKLMEPCESRGQSDTAYSTAGQMLDRMTLFSNDPGNSRVFAVLTREGPRWRVEMAPFLPQIL